MTVGEVFNSTPEQLEEFIGENGYFSTMFDFSTTVFGQSVRGPHANQQITPEDYKKCVFDAHAEIKDIGFLANIIENHDEPRGVSQYLPEDACHDKGKKLLAAEYFLLKGIPFIYQGQELGMENMNYTSIDEIDDVSSKAEYEVCIRAGLTPEEAMKAVNQYSRDNSRTPFQWDDSENAGFTEGKPWLPVNPNYTEINRNRKKILTVY